MSSTIWVQGTAARSNLAEAGTTSGPRPPRGTRHRCHRDRSSASPLNRHWHVGQVFPAGQAARQRQRHSLSAGPSRVHERAVSDPLSPPPPNPLYRIAIIKTGGARVSASESVANSQLLCVFLLLSTHASTSPRRRRLAADARFRSFLFREGPGPSCDGVHRRDAARAAGPPPAQAAASGVGRRPCRDASGIHLRSGPALRLSFSALTDLSISGGRRRFLARLGRRFCMRLRGCWCRCCRVRLPIYRIAVSVAFVAGGSVCGVDLTIFGPDVTVLYVNYAVDCLVRDMWITIRSPSLVLVKNIIILWFVSTIYTLFQLSVFFVL